MEKRKCSVSGYLHKGEYPEHFVCPVLRICANIFKIRTETDG